ncbi:MAG: CoA-transferase [Acidimicrobiales bacterium]
MIAGDATPFELADRPASDVDQAIAAHAASFIPDGATLQTGIGGIPNTVAALLADGPGGGYGIHSEMFTTGLMRLCQAGKVTNDHKGEFDGFAVTTSPPAPPSCTSGSTATTPSASSPSTSSTRPRTSAATAR